LVKLVENTENKECKVVWTKTVGSSCLILGNRKNTCSN